MIDREHLNGLLESRKLHAKDILKKVLKDSDEWEAIDSAGVETYRVDELDEWVADVGLSTEGEDAVTFKKECRSVSKRLRQLYSKAQVTEGLDYPKDYGIRLVFGRVDHGTGLEYWGKER